MSSARPVTAASGMPPAMPFAVVMRSGTTPSCSLANQSPVRQKPDWTSSAMKRIPCSVHHSDTRRIHPSDGTMNPPSPWIGSRITAAVFCSPTCAWTIEVKASKASSAHCFSPVGQRYGYAIGARYTSRGRPG